MTIAFDKGVKKEASSFLPLFSTIELYVTILVQLNRLALLCNV